MFGYTLRSILTPSSYSRLSNTHFDYHVSHLLLSSMPTCLFSNAYLETLNSTHLYKLGVLSFSASLPGRLVADAHTVVASEIPKNHPSLYKRSLHPRSAVANTLSAFTSSYVDTVVDHTPTRFSVLHGWPLSDFSQCHWP